MICLLSAMLISYLINKALQDEGTSDNAGYLPQLAIVNVFFFLFPVLSELVYVCLLSQNSLQISPMLKAPFFL